MKVVIWCDRCEKEVAHTEIPAVSTAGFGATYILVPEPCPHCKEGSMSKRTSVCEECGYSLVEGFDAEMGTYYVKPCPFCLADAREEGRRDATEEIADRLAEQAHPEPGPPY